MNLSDYIASDLEAKLRRGELSLADLTLARLGKRYQVSFTPVRKAIDNLVQRGLLVRGENGRVSIQPGLSALPPDITATEARPVDPPCRDAAQRSDLSPPNVSPPNVSPPNVSPPKEVSDWEIVLSGRIVRLSLLGKSIFLREESTAAKFGIGRTLLRQIFSRLSGRGLLQHVPRRGWRVRPFEPDDLADYIEVRVTLELKAMDLARPRIDVSMLAEMLRGNMSEADVSEADVSEASKLAQPVIPHPLDNRLHEYFIDTAGNRYIRDFFERHGGYYNQVFDLAAPELQVVQAMAEQHRRILRAAIDDQWLEAKAAMAEHIRAQLPIVSRLIQQSTKELGKEAFAENHYSR
ncbi:GntR family transcriptional regulator [Planctomycetaceae bacterium SH139]